MGANARRKGFDSEVLFGAIRTDRRKHVVTFSCPHDIGTRRKTLRYDIGYRVSKAVAALHAWRWHFELNSTNVAALTAGM